MAVLLIAPAGAYFRLRWLGRWETLLARLAHARKAAILLCAALPLLLRAALLPWFPPPQPRVQDEFTFLLGADTLAHGRLANPQHPEWVHFENMHLLSRPVYASAFPIGPSVALAAGKLLFGHPWAGVWLGVAGMCGAICWMLQGWVPQRWALVGGLLAALRFGVATYWMNSYWGGAVAAAGGALVLGALPRLLRRPRWQLAAVMGAGLAILANSRPFEGAVFSLAVTTPLLVWIFRGRYPSRRALTRRVILPLGVVLAVTGAGMGYYFARVSGKPWVMPYVLYRNTMGAVPHFIFQSPTAEPYYNNAEMRDFFMGWEVLSYQAARHPLVKAMWRRMEEYWRFYLGPLLSIPLLVLPQLWRDRRTRPLLLMMTLIAPALAGQVWQAAHYAAPATGLIMLMVVLGMQKLRRWRWRQLLIGRTLVSCIVPASALLLAMQVAAGPASAERLPSPAWRWPPRQGEARAKIQRQLAASPGKHLVLVRYALRNHDTGNEWVYNDADIDGSRVVWARELDFRSNQKLLRYFEDRHVWLVEADLPDPQLVAYRDASFRPMPFVRLGAPGIEVLRSVDEVRLRVREQAATAVTGPQGCALWNAIFTRVTGVMAPETNAGCGGKAGEAVPFEAWFSWLEHKRSPR